MTLGNVLLCETDNINGTDGVDSYCKIYQFWELFLTVNPQIRVHGKPFFFIFAKMLSHTCR